MSNKLISVITPCLNEEKNIPLIYSAIKSIFSELTNYSYEHIFIDNKSSDNTRDILKKLAKEDKNIKVIFNSRNYGQSASPFYALQQSKGDAAIMIVADLQDPPELIKDFIKEWEKGFKTVIGIKNKSKGNKLAHCIKTFFYRTINKFSEIELYKNFMGFGLYDKKVINLLKEFNEPEPYLRGIIADINLKVKKIEYTVQNRSHGKTKNNYLSLMDLGLTAFTSYSKFPIRLITIFSFIFAVISLLTGVFYFIYKILYWDTFALGIAPLIIILSVFFSLTFIFLGIMAEYIGAINTRFRNKPTVIEEERINFED